MNYTVIEAQTTNGVTATIINTYADYPRAEQKYRDAQDRLNNADQTQTILNAIGRFVTNPPVAAATT